MVAGDSLKVARSDYVRGLLAWRIWLSLGMGDIRIRYKRTVLGPLWITLSMTVTFVSVGMLFSAVYKNDVHQFLPYLAAGMVTWAMIGAIANEGPAIFVNAHHIIASLRLPLVVHVLRCVVRNAMIFFYNSVAAVMSYFILGGEWHNSQLLLLLTLPLFFATLFSGGLILAIVGARYRDLAQIIGVSLQLLFFMTPIMWHLEDLPNGRKWWVSVNPLYHLVEIVRAPMLGGLPGALSVTVSALFCLSLTLLAFALFCLCRRRISYWL